MCIYICSQSKNIYIHHVEVPNCDSVRALLMLERNMIKLLLLQNHIYYPFTHEWYTINDFPWGKYKDWSTHVTWYSPETAMDWSILVFIKIESHLLFYYMTLNLIWINTFWVSILLNSPSFTVAKRRLCSPDTPVCPTSAIINLIVYQRWLVKTHLINRWQT